jgi:hypothetical protein
MPFGIGQSPQSNPYAPQGGQNPYYNNQSDYGGQLGFGWLDAPFGGTHYFNQPGAGNQAGYTAWSAPWGGGYDPFSQWTQAQRPRINQGYEAALGTNPDLKWTDFLQALGGEHAMRAQFGNLSPQQRGENRASFVPPSNWQFRQ